MITFILLSTALKKYFKCLNAKGGSEKDPVSCKTLQVYKYVFPWQQVKVII